LLYYDKNLQFGTCWIYNTTLTISKKINKDELDKALLDEWVKGRKCFVRSIENKLSESGVIGSRTRLKISGSKDRTGSIPVSPTIGKVTEFGLMFLPAKE
jgi:hypothetical protein